MPTNAGEENVILAKGQILFEQGDVGGDLYIIQEGEIDIYTVKDGQEVSLSHMKAGEVIGLLSCMTREPRLASARALKESSVRKVKYENITGLIKSLPPWMKIVIKEFTLRINQMNKLYSDSVSRIKALKAQQISRLYTAAQMAAAITACAEMKQVMIDEIAALIPEQVLDLLESFMGRPREELDEIFQVFVDSGMIKLKIEQDKKRKYFTVANAQKLKTFSEFVKQSSRGKNKKLVKTEFANKEQRILSALVRYCAAMKLDLQSNVQLASKDLKTSLRSVTGQEFEVDALLESPKLGLVSLEGEAPLQKVCFNPSSLSFTLTHLSAYRKLDKLEELAFAKQK